MNAKVIRDLIKRNWEVIPISVLGGMTAYDFLKGKLQYPNEVTAEFMRGKPITAKEVKEALKKHKKEVIVISSKRELDKNKEVFSKKPFLPGEDDIIIPVIEDVLKKKDNALAAPLSKNKDLIVVPSGVSKIVALHEIGHLKDFARKKIWHGEEDPYYKTHSPWHRLGQVFWKPKYKREVIEAERNAWSYVPETPRKKQIQEEAEKTYMRAFHLGRASALGTGLKYIVPSLLGLNVLRRVLAKKSALEGAAKVLRKIR